jgi:sulfite exporter TauE/SafE
MLKTIAGLFILGVSFGAGPCLASCGPLVLCYIAGSGKNTLKALISYTLFSLARISVYIVLALLLYFLGQVVLARFMSGFSKAVFVAGGIFIILVGIFLGLGKKLKYDRGSILTLGLVTGLVPCAPLLSILFYTALIAKSWLASVFYALAFGIGTFLSPLILLVLLAGRLPAFLPKDKELYRRIFNLICGAITIFLGLQLIRRAF